MSMFGNLKSEGLEETQDRLGGYQPLETGPYTGTIKAAYAGESQGGAKNVTLLVDLEGGREYRETVYVTNKKGENWFLNPNDKSKKVPLPGFTIIEDICLVTTEKPLSDQNVEEKVLNIYDYEAKKELPKSVPVLVDLTGKEVTLGIVNTLENKSEKQGDGSYAPIADTRHVNTIDKVFHTATKMTTVEARQGLEPKFYDAWVERNQGITRDKREIKDGDGGQSGRPGRASSGPPKSGADAAPRKSLFGAQS